MNQQPADTEVSVIKDVESIEILVKGFWERVQTLGELVKQHRRDNKTLLTQVEQLEGEVNDLRAKIHEKDLEYRRLRAEFDQMLSGQSTESMSAQEREVLKDQIRGLISRINSHL